MHDINPLGTTMHLRELDRQATPRFWEVAAGRSASFGAALVRARLGRFLSRLRAGCARLLVRAG